MNADLHELAQKAKWNWKLLSFTFTGKNFQDIYIRNPMTNKTKWTLKQPIHRFPHIPLRSCPICIAKNTNLHDQRSFVRSSSRSRSVFKCELTTVWANKQMVWSKCCCRSSFACSHVTYSPLQTFTSSLFWYANLKSSDKQAIRVSGSSTFFFASHSITFVSSRTLTGVLPLNARDLWRERKSQWAPPTDALLAIRKDENQVIFNLQYNKYLFMM